MWLCKFRGFTEQFTEQLAHVMYVCMYVLHFQWPHSQFSMPHTSQEWSNPIVNITLESIRLIMCVYTCVYILASVTMVAIT